MAIEVRCPSCSKLLKAKETMAGKRVKCPACGEPVTIPSPGDEEVYDAEVVPPEDEYGLPADSHEAASDEEPDEEPEKRACPMCGEMINVAAKKCRYCGEVFGKKKKKKSSGSGDDDNLNAGEWFLCICCSNIGCIVGIVYACQGKSKGAKMIGISILVNIIAAVVQVVLSLIAEAN